MAPTITSGVVDTGTVLAAEKVVDMAPEIKMLETDTTQFTTALMKLPQNQATRERVDWLEDQLMVRTVTLGASATSAATALAFSTGDSATLRVRDLLRNQSTGEAYLVTAISADSAVQVTRAIGGTGAASSASGVQCLIVSNAFEQGADVGTSKVTQRSNQYNYTQIVRHNVSFTNTQGAIELYGGRYEAKEVAKKAVEHKRAIEQTVFWGARSSTAGVSHPIQTMGGAIEYISTNTNNQSGTTLTASEFDTLLIDYLQFCKKPLLFVAPTVAYNFSQMPSTAYRTNDTGAQSFGIQVDAFISGAYGTSIPIVVKKEWNDFTIPTSGNSGLGYGGVWFLIDMSRVQLRPLRDRSTKLYPDRQGNGEDRRDLEYITEVSLQFEVEKAHAFGKGVSRS